MAYATPIGRVLGASMIIAPVLLAAATIAYGLGGGMNRDVLGGTIQMYALAAFGLAVIGLVLRLASRRPRLAAVLLVPATIGVAGGIGFGVDSIHAGLPGGSKLIEIDPAAWGPSLQVTGMIFPPTLAVIGIALAVTRTAPAWAALALALGAVMFPLSRVTGIVPLALAADVVLIVGLGRIGLELLREEPAEVPARAATGREVSSPA